MLELPTPPLSPNELDAFIHATRIGDIKAVHMALVQNPHWVNAPNTLDNNSTALHYAVLLKSRRLVEFLLSKGANPDLPGHAGARPLHWAASTGLPGICWALVVKGGAQMDMFDVNGYMPVHLAAQAGETQCVLLLLALSRSGFTDTLLKSLDSGRRSTLQWAALKGHAELVSTLCIIAAYGNCSRQLHDHTDLLYGMTALHWAAHHTHANVCKELVKWGSDPSVRDLKQRTPLDMALAKGFQKYFELALLDSGITLGKSQLYLRVNPGIARFWVGRILPNFHIPYLLLTLGYANRYTYFVAIAMLLAVHYFIGRILMPTIPLLETSFMHTLHWNWYVIGWCVLIYYIIPGTLHSACLNQIESIIDRPLTTALLCLTLSVAGWYLRKTGNTNPGVIERALNLETVQKVVLDLGEQDLLSSRSLCFTCMSRKPLRSKHCRVCNQCVARFDHHCPWTGQCVGNGNHRFFMVYVYSLCLSGYLYVFLGYKILTAHTGLIDIVTIRANNPVLSAFILLVALGNAMLSMLVIYQTRLIAMNETTNEVSNAHRLDYMKDPETGYYKNAFHRGPTRNCLEFWNESVDYRSVHTIPVNHFSKIDCATNCKCNGNNTSKV